MKILFALPLLLALAGCKEVPPREVRQADQCMRAELFKQCMTVLPKGPQSLTASGNDWAEVVDECGSVSYYQSIRNISQIKPECR